MRRADTALLAAKRMTSQIRVHSPELDVATLETPRRAQAGRPRRGARRRRRRQGRRRLRPQRHRRRPGGRHGRARRPLARAGASACALAGLLHDVGYLDVDDAIFAKDEPPTDAEWNEIASHAERGARILDRCGFGEIATWVRHHHERLDGEGYPDGLAGEDIPIESRILHVADAYEAMTRGHSYQPRMTAEAALAELERLAGTQFDPQCVAALRRRAAGRTAA